MNEAREKGWLPKIIFTSLLADSLRPSSDRR